MTTGFLLSDLVPPTVKVPRSSHFSQWLPCASPLIPSARGVAAGPPQRIPYERLAILGHAPPSSSEACPPTSALLHLIFSHVAQLQQQQVASSSRKRNEEGPLVLLLTGTSRTEMKRRLEKERNAWAASMNADVSARDGEAAHVAKWFNIWDKVEIRYVPSLHHLLALLSLLRKSLPLDLRHENVRIADPGPTGKVYVTREHQRVVLLPRTPTLVIIEGLSHLLGDSHAVSHLTNVFSFVFDLSSHLSGDSWRSARSRARRSGGGISQTQHSQMQAEVDESSIARAAVPVVLFDQELANMTLPLVPRQRSPPAASGLEAQPSVSRPAASNILLSHIVARSFDYIVDITELPSSHATMRDARASRGSDTAPTASHVLTLQRSNDRPLAPSITLQQIRAAYIPVDEDDES